MTDNAASDLEFTGERYLPDVPGQIELEHFHRYVLAAFYVRGKRVLDVASGEGYGSNVLAQSANSVIGVDISGEAIGHARRRYVRHNLRFEQGDAAAIPVESSSIDIVVSFETIEHHDKHDEMLAEIRRVLVPGGLLIISSPNKLHYSDIPGYDNPYHIKEMYKEQFRELLQKNFANVDLLGQRVVYGSLIAGKTGPEQGFRSFIKRNELELSEEFAAPLYDLAFASDSPLPTVGASFYEQIQDGRLAAEYLHQERIRQYEALQRLDETRQRLEAQIKSLNQAAEEREVSLKEMGQTASQRAGEAENLKRHKQELQERNAELQQQLLTGGEREESLVRDRDGAASKVQQLETELQAIRNSRMWRAFESLRRLIRAR